MVDFFVTSTRYRNQFAESNTGQGTDKISTVDGDKSCDESIADHANGSNIGQVNNNHPTVGDEQSIAGDVDDSNTSQDTSVYQYLNLQICISIRICILSRYILNFQNSILSVSDSRSLSESEENT